MYLSILLSDFRHRSKNQSNIVNLMTKRRPRIERDQPM
jgi:hypothetical protein